MKFLDIGTVAARTGMPPSRLRYYEEIGLIKSCGRSGLRRQFEPDVVMQLKLIAMGQAAGFSLQEIAGMFGAGGAPDVKREMLHERADALDRQIRQLEALRDTVRHVAECPAPSHVECPTFRRLVELAGRRGVETKRRRAPSRKAPASGGRGQAD